MYSVYIPWIHGFDESKVYTCKDCGAVISVTDNLEAMLCRKCEG